MQHGGDSGGGWYRIGRRIESGVTGEVFEATHPRLPGPCAIKVLPPALTDRIDALPRFHADVEAVAALRHPNVLQVIEVGSRPDIPAFVVTERLDGQTLAERLGRRSRVPISQAVAIVKGVAAGLQAAHHAGVAHGALNPGSIFLARSEGYEHGIVKLLDFGIIRLCSVDTVASSPAETIRYLSPEQAAGQVDEVDVRSDQFALAAIAYLMLSGRDAYPGDSAVSVLYELVHGQPSPQRIAEGGAAVEAVIRRGLARDRRHRFDSISDFAHAFAISAGAEQRHTPSPAPAPAVPPPAVVIPATAAAAQAGSKDDGSDLFTHPFFQPSPEEARPRRGPRRRVRLIRRRPPARGGRLLLLLLGLAIAWLAGALAYGWRPPLEWRQSRLWQELGLPKGE